MHRQLPSRSWLLQLTRVHRLGGPIHGRRQSGAPIPPVQQSLQVGGGGMRLGTGQVAVALMGAASGVLLYGREDNPLHLLSTVTRCHHHGHACNSMWLSHKP